MAALHFPSLKRFRSAGRAALERGPVALVVIEDTTGVASTLDHLTARGFAKIVAFAPPDIPLPDHNAGAHRVTMDTRQPDALCDAVNAALTVAPAGTWLHACYNAEYLFYPFCEQRSISELLAFHSEERREAMLSYVVDLYPPNLTSWLDDPAREPAYLDKTGYYALSRDGTDPDTPFKERQLDFYGGLRWRFEEHAHPKRRRIDRIGLFRARRGLNYRDDHTFDDEEYNTYSCPWHNNLTAALCSFRAAKALQSNPVSRDAIDTFLWEGSIPFDWSSRQLTEFGLMEPGQWF